MFKIHELLKAANGRLICGDRNTPISGISIDTRTIKPGEAFIAIKGPNFDGQDFIEEALKKGAKAVISGLSGYPVIRLSGKAAFIKVRDTTKTLGDIAHFHRQKFDIPIIAVTGSNGKTTVKDMIAWVLSSKFKVLKTQETENNHIGLPKTLLGMDSSVDYAVLELGSNHFGEIEYLAKIIRPDIGVITNIGPSHLEYFRNLKGVFKEKCSLIKYLKSPGIAVLNSDDRLLKGCPKTCKKTALSFGIKSCADFRASDIKALKGEIEFCVNRRNKFILNTLGRFNVYNALIAITIARIFGMDYKEIATSLASFKFPQNRLQTLELNNIRFINDTYNSNPLSLKLALDSLSSLKIAGRKIFVMGDMLELGGLSDLFHAEAGKQAAGACDIFLAVGKLSGLAAKAARKKGLGKNNIFACGSSLEARDILFKKISPNPDDVVLVKGSRAMKMEEILET